MAATQTLPLTGASAAPLGTQPGGTPTVPAVTASPMTVTNSTSNIQVLYVQAAAASTLTVAKRGVTLSNQVQAAATNSTVPVILGPGESAVVTYTVAPVLVIDTP